MTPARVSALAFAAALGFSAVAQAQTAPPPPPPAAGPHWDNAAMREHREAREAAHMKALHDVLAIRPEQEGAFQAFVASMHPTPPAGMGDRREPGAAWRDHDADAQMTTPQRVEAMIKRFDERTARIHEELERHAAAVNSFYAVLSPEQKRTLDALPALRGGMGGHEGWGGGHGDHGPHDGMGGGRPPSGE